MRESDLLAQLLREAGSVAFGSASAAPVEEDHWNYFQEWIAKGFHAGMEYMKNYPEIRRDPRQLLAGAQTIISIAFNYRQPNPFAGVATYALGQDYHKVLRKRLKKVVRRMKEEFGGEWRICIDSAPVLERYWAEKCGIGKRSPVHGNIIVPGVGSMVFLAELVTTLNIRGLKSFGKKNETENSITESRCPTGALQPGGVVDSRRCINYLTIEKKTPLTVEEEKMVGNAVFGCDVCQRVCIENQGDCPEVLPEFKPMEGLKEYLRGKSCNFDIKNSPISRGQKPV